MKASSARSCERVPPHCTVDLPGCPADGATLTHDAHLGAGVHILVDMMRLDRWRLLPSPAAAASAPLVAALYGAPDPWLRIAVVGLLDRWLYTPVNQSLVDAEAAVSRLRAARTLPEGAARTAVLGDALRQARGASHDVVAYLRELTARSQYVPGPLCGALRRLVAGYDDMAGEVDGPDRELAIVGETWRRLRRTDGVRRLLRAVPAPGPTTPGGPCPGPSSMIDPRQLRARMVGLSGDPAAAEIELSVDAPVVHVRVPAFARALRPVSGAGLAVRLVERRTARSGAHALLRGRADAPFFEATLPLCGMDPGDVRADVFDPFSGVRPARADVDEALQDARRAVVFLGGWRRLVGLARLPGGLPDPAHRLRELTALVRSRAGGPVFAGGPTSAELDVLADLGDDPLRRRLRRRLTPAPADLLVAELAAAHAER